MLLVLVTILGAIIVFIGGYLWHHQNTNLLGITVTNKPQLTKFCRFYGLLFIILGLIIIITNLLGYLIIATIFMIISMLTTIALTWQFSVFLKKYL
ncbi:hypothetical protein [Periweissella fabalis]|uniref:DUF3784 domain-containing protein n=1 Tax=Periweissella fabalis TaxID=1070421 RepID=A0A7X6N365_9LACO|nr:hypothetical protein [Periweissella fabalis]MCM0598212.1 hypothetical protein [Periweissella fabalis]NKZ24853.1 hypothetical protein [Periweissella fabalis]